MSKTVKGPSRRTGAGLDLLNFFVSDIQSGVGPYLAIVLAGEPGWTPQRIGFAMATSAASGAIAQVPAGLFVDRTKAKRTVVLISALAVTIGCLSIAHDDAFWPTIAAQALLGIACSLLPPAISAITLGLVHQDGIGRRSSRNAAFNHAGSLAAALLIISAGPFFGIHVALWLIAAFAAASIACLALISPSEIDHDAARGGGSGPALPLSRIVAHRDIQIFLAGVLFFYAGIQSMLPLVNQAVAARFPARATELTPACILLGQSVMILAAWAAGRLLSGGRSPLTLAAFAVAIVPARGLSLALAAWTATLTLPSAVALQALEGLSLGVFSVMTIVIAADLTHGTGRFNFTQSLVALAICAGGALGSALGGLITQHFGYAWAFTALGLLGLFGLPSFTARLRPIDPQDHG